MVVFIIEFFKSLRIDIFEIDNDGKVKNRKII